MDQANSPPPLTPPAVSYTRISRTEKILFIRRYFGPTAILFSILVERKPLLGDDDHSQITAFVFGRLVHRPFFVDFLLNPFQ